VNWHNEPWRKLYTRITGDWLQLSVTARGISCELLKYAKDDGFLCRTRGKDPAIAVALVLGSHPHELETVTDAVTELVTDGYLDVQNDAVYVRNFEFAQERRTPAAVRQKRYRDHKSLETHDQKHNIPLCPVTSRPGNALQGSETRRNDTKRSIKSPAAPSAAPSRNESKRPRWAEVIAAYHDAWMALHSLEGKPPVIEAADTSALARLYDRQGPDETIALIQRFVSDPDPHIARRGHMLRDLSSRQNAYRAKPATSNAATKRNFKEASKHAAETRDRTNEL
jgi:hypothetical protein